MILLLSSACRTASRTNPNEPLNIAASVAHSIQPVPENITLEMIDEMQIEICDGQSSGLFSNESFEKSPAMTIEDFCFAFR